MAGDVLCVAEHRRGTLAPGIFEALKAARTLAEPLGRKVHALVMGEGLQASAKDLGERGADVVHAADHPCLQNPIEETQAALAARLIEAERPALVLFTGSTLGRSTAARTAVLARMGLAADVLEIKTYGGNFKAVRTCYGGSQLVEVSAKGPLLAILQKGAYPRAEPQAERAFETRSVTVDPASLPARARFVEKLPEEEGAKDISQADVIVSGGYGLGKAEGFRLVEDLAKVLGGAVGASRRAVDIGWIPYRHQVGLTGRTVKPKLYIACGISGQIQHLAGMGRADTIVAINTDPDCPMMKLANYAVVGDLYEILPALIETLRQERR